jgi:beta-1,4-glucosyltransferase
MSIPTRMINPDSIQLSLGGFCLTSTTAENLQRQLQCVIEQKQQIPMFFANTNFIVKCQPLRARMVENNALIINDGVGIDIATWLIHRTRFPQNLNGTDFIPEFLYHLRHQARVFLYGGKPGVAERAANTLHNEFNVSVVGTCDGYAQARDVDLLLNAINESKANIVLVAMGNPLQEEWILDHYHKTHANVFIGVGACLDFLAGDKPRAPEWIRRIRMEWCYRLCLEPARLARRYTLDIIVFLSLCLRTGKQITHLTSEKG